MEKLTESDLKVLLKSGLTALQISRLTGMKPSLIKKDLPAIPQLDFKSYLQYARSISNKVAHKFGIKMRGWYFNPIEGYKANTILSVLCHPANLNPGNPKKEKISKLKSRIKRWEKRNGKFVFPDYLVNEFVKATSTSSKDCIPVVAFDPGSSNFGCFAGRLRIKNDALSGIELLDSKMLQNPIKSLGTDFKSQADAYRQEIRQFLLKYKPAVVVIERFQSRGLRGTTVELVNVMIGILSEIIYNLSNEGLEIELKTPIASQWKNALNKHFSLEDLYQYLPGSQLHRLDACLMSLFAVQDGIKDVYSFLNEKRQQAVIEFIKDYRR
jgi:hypothetical protein